MIDKGRDLRPEIAGQEVVFEQDAVLEGLVPTLDLALGLGVVRRNADQTIMSDDQALVEKATVFEIIQNVQIKPGLMTLQLDPKMVGALCGFDSIPNSNDLQLALPFTVRRREVEVKLVIEGAKSIDETLMRNVANANHWYKRMKKGATFDQIAAETKTSKRRIQQLIHLAFLAPDIIRQITQGKQPLGLTSDWLLLHSLPVDWEEQRKRIANL